MAAEGQRAGWRFGVKMYDTTMESLAPGRAGEGCTLIKWVSISLCNWILYFDFLSISFL